MTTRFPLIVLCALALLSPFAAKADEAAPVAAQDFVLANGLKVILLPAPQSEVTAVSFVMPQAALRQTDAQAGIEQLMMALLTKGTALYPKAYFDRELERRGTALNGAAMRDYSVLHLSTVAPFLGDGLALMAEALKNAAFPAAEFENERQAMLSAVRAKQDSPDANLAQALNDRYFAGHPYHPELDGSEASLRAVTRAQVADFHAKWLINAQAFVVVVGPFGRADLEPLLARTLGSLPQAPKGELRPVPPLRPNVKEPVLVNKDIPTRYIVARFTAPEPQSPDYAPLVLGMKVLRDRLWENVRTKGGLAYAVSSRLVGMAANYGFLYVTTTDETGAMARSLAELKRLAAEPIGPEELAAAKSVYTTDYYMGAQSIDGLCSQLTFAELYLGGYANRRAVIDGVRAATPEAVRQAAVRWVKGLAYGVLGKQETLNLKAFVEP